MRLRSVRVNNYKCISDSTEFRISDLTCLVGKNESGKTAILQALEKLNPLSPGHRRFEFTEYPRHRSSEFRRASEGESNPVIETCWTLEDADRQSIIDKFGVDFLTSDEIHISRGYDNVTRWKMQFDESRLAQHLLDSSDLHPLEREEIGEPQSIANLEDLLRGLARLTPSQAEMFDRVQHDFPGGLVTQALIRHLKPRLPRFLYFADYYKLPGRVSLDDLSKRQAEGTLRHQDRLFNALLALVGTDPEDVVRTDSLEELYAKLEGVSTKISAEIFSHWSQNRHLKVDFRLDPARSGDPPPFDSGHVFSIRVQDTRQGVSVSFDERSSGFVWFFSFLVWLTHLREQFGRRLIILLDEPALSLHGAAQRDLLRFVKERLVHDFQVIYTTHSPFMIDHHNLSSVRMVDDGSHPDVQDNGRLTGSKVFEHGLSLDPNTLLPLQTAMAYNLTESIKVGPNILLVDNPSDLLYFQWFSSELKARGRTGLDLRWLVTPAGGLSKISSFMPLFHSPGVNVAVIAGSRGYAAETNGRVLQKGILQSGNIFSAECVTGIPESDVEDIIGRNLYVDLVNRTFALNGNRRIPRRKRGGAPVRVTREVQDLFQRRFGAQLPFDRYLPATFLSQWGSQLVDELRDLDPALDRFEQLFTELNAVLYSQHRA